MEKRQRQASRFDHRAAVGIGLALVYAVGMFNYWVPTIRLSSPLANTLAFALLQLIPIVLLISALISGPWWARVLWAVPLAPVAAVAGVLGSCSTVLAGDIVLKGSDPSFELIGRVTVAPGQVSVYRTNGGATTSFGIVVRQECQLLPGLLRVRNVYTSYPASAAQVEVIRPSAISVQVPPYQGSRSPPSGEEIALESLWCMPAA